LVRFQQVQVKNSNLQSAVYDLRTQNSRLDERSERLQSENSNLQSLIRAGELCARLHVIALNLARCVH